MELLKKIIDIILMFFTRKEKKDRDKREAGRERQRDKFADAVVSGDEDAVSNDLSDLLDDVNRGRNK